jgi:hypothetical protein
MTTYETHKFGVGKMNKYLICMKVVDIVTTVGENLKKSLGYIWVPLPSFLKYEEVWNLVARE